MASRRKCRPVNGENSHRRACFLRVRDVECFLIDHNYHEMVQTGDIRYAPLINKIVNATRRHKIMIDEKIRKVEK